MKDESVEAVCFYNQFQVANSTTFYKLSVGLYDSINSNGGDSLNIHNG